MDLRHLRYFVVLAEELHFGRAAARLGISQPPLSQQIRALEQELGAALLERTSRRAKLTEAGRLFLHEAEKTLAQADRARDVARRAQLGELGEFNVAFTPSAPLTARFRRIIQGFRSAHPDVHLMLQELGTRQQIEALTEGDLQIGFLRTPGERPAASGALTVKAIDREELMAVLRSDHPMAQGDPNGRIPLASLAHDPFVVLPRQSGESPYDQVIMCCRDAGFNPKLRQEAREAVTLLGLVAGGIGVTLLAASFQPILFEGVVMRRLTKPPIAATWLAHHKGDSSPITRGFLKIAAAQVGGGGRSRL